MSEFRPISLTRQQLSRFIPDHEGIKEFERLFSQDIILYTNLFEQITEYLPGSILQPVSQTIFADASSGDINITLPNPSECVYKGRSVKIAIHKIDATVNNVNILPNGSELVVFEASQSLLYQAEILNLITNGTDWYLGA